MNNRLQEFLNDSKNKTIVIKELKEHLTTISKIDRARKHPWLNIYVPITIEHPATFGAEHIYHNHFLLRVDSLFGTPEYLYDRVAIRLSIVNGYHYWQEPNTFHIISQEVSVDELEQGKLASRLIDLYLGFAKGCLQKVSSNYRGES